ncbi:MAG: glycosyltransferase [bacterium]
MKLSIVMPVFNEINTISEILRQVQEVPLEKEIIIVDDYSTDGTREILHKIEESTIKIIFNDKNMGKGFALRKGFEHVTGEIVIIQDADLEYYPSEYPLLIQKIIEGKADVVYGSRFLGARRVFHFYHYMGNKILNLIANIIYNTILTDLMTCYKAFRTDVLRALTLRANGFGIESEITAQIFKRKFRVYEVPISYNGRDYDEGKKITWKDFFRSLYWLLRCKFEIYDVGEETLLRMRLMKNNNTWTFNGIKPYLGETILEIGSGIGNISKFLVSMSSNFVLLTDINKAYLEYLRDRFVSNPKVKIISHDISSPDLSELSPYAIDTVVCLNVLEHIENDEKALENIYSLLEKNGRLILLVPALKMLYGTLDEKLDHFRRYDRSELIKKLEKKNFKVEEIYYQNFISSFGWFLNSRITRRKCMSSAMVIMVDKFIPLFALTEKMVKIPFGLSLIAICRKEGP